MQASQAKRANAEMKWADYLSAGDGAIDIGANIGSITLQMANAVGPTGYVLAVEPNRVNYAHCLGNTERQMLWVNVKHAAVTDIRDHWVTLHHDEVGTRHSLWPENLVDDARSFRDVPTVTVDQIAPSVPKLKAIKVDTQGAETLVLRGATETLKKDLVWHVEVWPFGLTNAGSSVDEMLGIFKAAGYRPQEWTWEGLIAAEHTSPYGSIDVVLTR